MLLGKIFSFLRDPLRLRSDLIKPVNPLKVANFRSTESRGSPAVGTVKTCSSQIHHSRCERFIRSLITPQGRDYLSNPVDENGVKMAAIASLALSMLAGALFLQFIRSEGRRSVRLQTELSLAHGIQKTLVPVIEKTLPDCEIYGVSAPSENEGGRPR
jgi:hypothetical protein